MLTDVTKVKAAGNKMKAEIIAIRGELFAFDGMTPEQAAANWTRVQEKWIRANQAWVETLPPFLRDGRSVAIEADYALPRNLAHQLQQFTLAQDFYKSHRNGLMKELSGLDASARADLERMVELHTKMVEVELSPKSTSSLSGARAELEKAKQEWLKTRGDSAKIDELLELNFKVIRAGNGVAATASEWIAREFQFPEYYRTQSGKGSPRAGEVLKRYFGFDSYIKSSLPVIEKILADMEMEIDVQARVLGTIESNIAREPPATPPAGQPAANFGICVNRGIQGEKK
jgi:hypothetical protein